MPKLRYEKAIPIDLKKHPDFNEKWVQARIQEDPSLLGLGDDLEVIYVEKNQPGGRLDLQLEDQDGESRYEVEIQLGPTNESHIIRTLEYWDVEAKRSTKHKHCAVIVAENITSRFLNVISLFNKSVPLIAIQMRALQVGEYVALNFTTVLNEFEKWDEVEEASEVGPPVWKGRESLLLVDECLSVLREIDSTIQKTERKYFIGLEVGGQVSNFVTFNPKKKFL